MHTINIRTPTSEEQALIARRAKPDVASYGCIVIFGIVPVYLLGILGSRIGVLISLDASIYGQWAGWFVAAILVGFAFVWFMPYERRQRQRASKDLADQIVQEIHVIEPRVIEIGLINDNEPILAFEIDDTKFLYLQGQWLRDSRTYGVETEVDPHEGSINGLSEPYSFPSSEFTVTRLPNSGEVLGIRVAGKYLAPQAVVEALSAEYEFGDSELLDGSVDDIAGILAREHQRRQT